MNPSPDLFTKRSPHGRGLMIVDDHELVRLGLRALVQSHVQVGSRPLQIFEARTLQSALELYSVNRADIDVVFLDLGLPDTQGLSALHAFAAHFPGADVVVLSGDASPQTMAQAMDLGAQAYLKKTGDLHEVIDYIQSLGLISDGAASTATRADARVAPTMMRGLTQRQVQIFNWLLEGRSNREIGQLASLAEGTVKNHVSTILLHFGARSRAQLISSMR